MRPFLLATLLALIVSPRPSLGESAEEAAYLEARQALLDLIDDVKAKRYRDRWERVIVRLDRSAKELARGDLRCAAAYNGARAYAEMAKVSYLQRDRDEADRRYRAVADVCPDSNLADDALYRAAEIHLGRDASRARAALEELVRRFPRGDMVPRAKEGLAAIAAREEAEGQALAAASMAPERPQSRSDARSSGGNEKAKAASEERAEALAEEVPGAHLPSAAEILAAMESSEGRLGAIEEAIEAELPFSVVAGLKIRRVVLDPGHGGKDTGAIGPDGAKEKELTLAMAKRLRAHLEALGLEVLLTREDDRTLSLEERTRFANEKGADLFLSIHVNAAHNRKAKGIETYTLNLNSDRYAMRLAARENASSERRIGDLQFILADLATKANTDDSVKLAKLVQGRMVSKLRSRHGKERIRDLGVKQALFFVLVGAKMPSILLETGFISHPEEGKRLQTRAYQEDVMRGVAEGVRQFILDREALASGGIEEGATGVF